MMIQPISGAVSGGAPAAAAGVKAAPEVRQPEAEAPTRTRRPAMDEYIPEKKSAGDKKAETCTGNTDQVDREIERLKKQKELLEQRLNSETDEAKRKQLEAKLARVENELAQKDNDAYRRQHTVFS